MLSSNYYKKMNAIVVLLGVVSIIIGASAIKCENPNFTCNINKLDEVFLKNHNLTLKCNKDQQCNIVLDLCDPCIKKSDNCYEKFKCLGETSVEIKEVGTFECVENQVCNSKFVQPCLPCVPKVCDKPKFSCNPNDNTLVNKDNLVFKCVSGYFCNSENKLPCTECINNHGVAGRSIFQFML